MLRYTSKEVYHTTFFRIKSLKDLCGLTKYLPIRLVFRRLYPERQSPPQSVDLFTSWLVRPVSCTHGSVSPHLRTRLIPSQTFICVCLTFVSRCFVTEGNETLYMRLQKVKQDKLRQGKTTRLSHQYRTI